MAADKFVSRITGILVSNGSVTEGEAHAMKEGFEHASQEQFDHFLVDEGLVDEDDLLAALAEYYQVPSFVVRGHLFDGNLLRKFSKSFLLRHGMIPLECDENILIMIASRPDDPELLPRIGEHVSYDIRFYVGLHTDICDAVKEFYDTSPTEDVEEPDRLEEEQLAADAETKEEVE